MIRSILKNPNTLRLSGLPDCANRYSGCNTVIGSVLEATRAGR